MKVQFIYPPFLEKRTQDEDMKAMPIGLYSLAAVLKKEGHDVELSHCGLMTDTLREMEKILKERSPQVLAFSVLHGNRWGAIDLARFAKRRCPEISIIFGGVGATCLYEHLLDRFPEIDVIVLGEGERTLPLLLDCIADKKRPDLHCIQGIAFKHEGKILNTGRPVPIEDLNSLPIPADYFEYQHISTSRGCVWECAFCGSPAFWERRIRYRSPNHVLRELELLYGKGLRFFYFSDDTLTINKTRVIQICRGILERGLDINWFAISRVNDIDEDILYWMRKAGCIQLSYGVESGSERIRENLKKKITKDQIKKAFSLTVQYGILPRVYFIYGSPGETEETIEESITLMKEIKPLGAIFYALDLFPGTELYESLKEAGVINDDLWQERIEGLLYGEIDSHLTKDRTKAFGKKLRTAFNEYLPDFVDAIQLVDRQDLYPFHADFCSRLAMTFSHGDYSKFEMIPEKDRIAEALFRKAIRYAPDHRAFLGLSLVLQKRGDWDASSDLLKEGLEWFPNSEHLHLTLGVNYLNKGQYSKAHSCFSRFPHSEKALYYRDICEEATKNPGQRGGVGQK
jgi:radical SAM superfamily enzyme YgiQ (UPF0313 family)